MIGFCQHSSYIVALDLEEIAQKFNLTNLLRKCPEHIDVDISMCLLINVVRGPHDRGCMVVGFTTTCAISAYHH